MSIKFNNSSLAEFSNATVCNEPLFLHVQTKIGELPENVECEASPLAFCVDEEVIVEAKEYFNRFGTIEIGDEEETLICFYTGVNSEKKKIEHTCIKNAFDFFEQSEKVKMQIIYKHIANGVIFSSIDGVIISPNAKIGKGTEIHATTEIRGESVIGENCVIGPCSIVSESKIGDGCKINASQVYDSEFENGVAIGPYTHIRPNCKLSNGVKFGAFVETKNSVIGKDTHASHLTYIGDSDVGERVNFGCGTITSNYDGKNKFRTTVGNDVFVGCNTNLVAPVKLGDGSYVAAGSTIVSDVPSGSLAIARSYQTVKEKWADKRRQEGKLK